MSENSQLAEPGFVVLWTAMPEIPTLLACAQRLKKRIGIRGGVVRNFLLGMQSRPGTLTSLVDIIDPFSDIDCVIDNELDWPSVGAAISSTFPFAGYHRWEVQTLDAIKSQLSRYEIFPWDRLIIWHEGFEDNQPRVVLEGLGTSTAQILEQAGLPALSDLNWPQTRERDPWTTVLDVLRFARYSLQYPALRTQPETYGFPDPSILDSLLSSRIAPIPPRILQRNLLRFNLTVLDIVTTAALLPPAETYLQQFWSRLPAQLREQSTVLSDFVNGNFAESAFVGGLVYRQRPSGRIRAKLLFNRDSGCERRDVKSLIPWTPLWSIQSAEDSCCRHTDFRNGAAVISWRSTKFNTPATKDVAFDFAPVALVEGSMPYAAGSVQRPLLLPIPGFVRTGPAVTLRIDHAFPSTCSGKKLRFFVGLVDARER